jgi:hypothetical protein
MEIEIPRRLVQHLLSILLVIGPLVVGILTSPYSEDDRPLLLSPRLARLNEYRRDVRLWVQTLQNTDAALTLLLEETSSDVFDQNNQVNRVYQQVKQVVEIIDQEPIPPTFEGLHELLDQTTNAYLETTLLVIRWISESGDENQQNAEAALSSAHEQLERLYVNPWINPRINPRIEVKP